MTGKELGEEMVSPFYYEDNGLKVGTGGMTKREAFTMAAMQALIMKFGGAKNEDEYSITARQATMHADATLHELAKEMS